MCSISISYQNNLRPSILYLSACIGLCKTSLVTLLGNSLYLYCIPCESSKAKGYTYMQYSTFEGSLLRFSLLPPISKSLDQ